MTKATFENPKDGVVAGMNLIRSLSNAEEI